MSKMLRMVNVREKRQNNIIIQSVTKPLNKNLQEWDCEFLSNMVGEKVEVKEKEKNNEEINLNNLKDEEEVGMYLNKFRKKRGNRNSN